MQNLIVLVSQVIAHSRKVSKFFKCDNRQALEILLVKVWLWVDDLNVKKTRFDYVPKFPYNA